MSDILFLLYYYLKVNRYAQSRIPSSNWRNDQRRKRYFYKGDGNRSLIPQETIQWVFDGRGHAIPCPASRSPSISAWKYHQYCTLSFTSRLPWRQSTSIQKDTNHTSQSRPKGTQIKHFITFSQQWGKTEPNWGDQTCCKVLLWNRHQRPPRSAFLSRHVLLYISRTPQRYRSYLDKINGQAINDIQKFLRYECNIQIEHLSTEQKRSLREKLMKVREWLGQKSVSQLDTYYSFIERHY